MAKSFFSAEEAAAALGTNEEGLKDLVREGKLREFRDGGKVNYKISDVEKVQAAAGAPAPSGDTDVSAESGEILLEPADESGIDLAPSSSDIMGLDGSDMLGGTASSTASGTAANEGSSVPSVGISVFDDEDTDEDVDPLAQTAMSDVAGLGLDGAGSGSGILDLTRESDDTSLGAELLEEIYTGDDQPEGKAESGIAALGDDTRAGLDEVADEDTIGDEPFEVESEELTGVAVRGTVRRVVEHAPDAVSSGLTSAMAVALAIMLVGALASVSLVQGTMPGLLSTIYSNLMYFSGGGLLVVIIAVAVSYFLARRAS